MDSQVETLANPPQESATDTPTPGNRQVLYRKTFSLKTLLVTIGSLVVLAVLLFFVHRWQIGNTANVFLEKAERHEQAEQWRDAAENVHHYVRLNPDDAQQAIRLAHLYGKVVEEQPTQLIRAVDLYYQALGTAQGDTQYADQVPDLRRELVALLLKTGQHKSAQTQIELQPRKEDAKGRRLLSDAEDRRLHALAVHNLHLLGDYVKIQVPSTTGTTELSVTEVLRFAVEANPGDLELSMRLADMYRSEPDKLSDAEKQVLDDYAKNAPSDLERNRLREQRRTQWADEIMNQAVERTATAEAFLARFHYRHDIRHPDTEADLKMALQLAPDNYQVVVAAGQYALERAAETLAGTQAPDPLAMAFLAIDVLTAPDDERVAAAKPLYQQAIDHFEHAKSLDPAPELAYLGLGTGFYELGQVERAVEVWTQGLGIVGRDNVSLNARLTEAHIKLADLSAAGQHLATLEKILADYQRPVRRVELSRTISLLKGRLYLAQGQPSHAVSELQSLLQGEVESKADRVLRISAQSLVAECFTTLGQWDQAASAYDSLTLMLPQPLNDQARVAAADNWIRAGRPATALRSVAYQRGAFAQLNDAVLLATAVALLENQIITPIERRDWTEFDQMYAELSRRPMHAQSWHLIVLQSRSELVKSEPLTGDERATHLALATETLRALQAERPYDVNLYRQLVPLFERLEAPEDADRCLVEMFQADPDSEITAVTAAQLYTMRGDVPKAAEVLRSAASRLPAAERIRLYSTLAVLQDAEDLKQLVQQEAPSGVATGADEAKIAAVARLVEQALGAGNLDDAARWTQQLRQLEGEAGTRWRFHDGFVALLQWEKQGPKADSALLHRAAEHQRYLAAHRPEWPHTFVLQGLLMEADGKPEAAVQGYQRALDLGERRLSIVQRLCLLLYSQNRLDDAQKVLQMATRQQIADAPMLSQMNISITARKGRLDSAIELAREDLKNRPNDVRVRMWLAELYRLSEQTDEAEGIYRETVALAPGEPAPWQAFMRFYARRADMDALRELLWQLQTQLESTNDGRMLLILAEGHGYLGDAEQAKQYADQAAELATAENPDLLNWNVNMLVSRGEFDEAVALLEREAAKQPGDAALRRTLASTLAARGAEGDFERAESMLLDSSSIDDTLLRALLLSRRASADYQKHVAQAQQILDAAIAEGMVNDGVRLLLAELLTMQSLWTVGETRDLKLNEARQQLVALADRPGATTFHILRMVDFLLLAGQDKEARTWFQRLHTKLLDQTQDYSRFIDLHGLAQARGFGDESERILDAMAEQLRRDNNPPVDAVATYCLLSLNQQDPDRALPLLPVLAQSGRNRYLPIQARLLGLTRGNEAARGWIEEQANAWIQDEPTQLANIIQVVAGTYLQLEMPSQAADWYARLAESTQSAQANAAQAVALAQADQLPKAMDLCERVGKSDSRLAAMVASAVLIEADATDELSARGEAVIQKSLRENPEDWELLSSLAVLRIRQQRDNDALKIYRQIVQAKPRDVSALNNLALLLLDNDAGFAEANNLIHRAIMLGGTNASFMDTKGVILTLEGRVADALPYLRSAVLPLNADPRHHFHLALALHRGGAFEAARQNYDLAVSNGLADQLLTRRDRELLEELERMLKTN